MKFVMRNKIRMNNNLRQKLVNTLRSPIDAFRSQGAVLETQHGPLIFQDNGANILAVAHLDTVHVTGAAKPRIKKNKAYGPQLDDRLGVWTLLHLLPTLGAPKYDILLCDSEEIGQSTAQYFETNKDYNWIFEFDRAGTDVVLYDYEDENTVTLLQNEGFKVGVGAFTDICELEHLGCKAFNFGVGYHKQHTAQCHADLNDTIQMASKFCEFAHAYKDIHLEHTPSPHTKTVWEYDDGIDICNDCHTVLDWQWIFCPQCGQITQYGMQSRSHGEYPYKLYDV